MGRNEIRLEQWQSHRTSDPCSTLRRILRGHPDLEARQSNRTPTDFSPKEHRLRRLVLILAGRRLLPPDLLPPHLVPSHQSRLRYQIRRHEPPPYNGPRHLRSPSRHPYHLDRLLHALHADFLRPRLHRHQPDHNLARQHRPRHVDRLPSLLRPGQRPGHEPTSHGRADSAGARRRVNRDGERDLCADAGRGDLHFGGGKHL